MNETRGLFKSLSADKLVFFENCLVLLTPPIYLNDPWDFLPKGRVPSEDEILKVWREVETDIAHSSVIALPAGFALREQQERLQRMRTGLTSTEFLGTQSRNYQEQISKFVGVVSLTELPLSRLMWAHYAQSHTGFAIELAADEESNYESFVIRGMGNGLVAAKVKYPSSHHQIPLAEDASNVLEVCCSKHPLWEYEREWRIVAFLRDSTPWPHISDRGCEERRFCVPFKPGNLQRVIFGMRMKPEVRQRLCNMLGREEFKHVQKQVTDIDPQTGKMVLNPL